MIHWISAESHEDLEEWDCNYCEIWLLIEKIEKQIMYRR